MFHLIEHAKIVEGLSPATDAAGRTGDYVKLTDARRAFVIFHITQGNAATVECSVFQATAANGAGAKAIPAVPVWSNLDCAASDELVKRDAAAAYETDDAVKHRMVVFQVDAAQLDTDNGFAWIAPLTGASNVANITAAQIILGDLRYSQATPPTAIA